jgi:DNA-binding transcriptional MerR regulator
MGKPALGKGMKDLLPKSVSITEERSDPDKVLAAKELDTNIERYLAQGFDVSPLRDLYNSDDGTILRGIEVFRDNVKKLTSATTILRSLEGYGYTSEIESIMQDIKNTQKADEVLRKVYRLKERTPAEPVPDRKGKETPRARVLRGLKVASETMTRPAQEPGLGFETTDVDSLMDDLADLGSAFTPEAQPEDEITRMLESWEKEGFFLDRIREILSESDRDPKAELARFSEEVERMRALRDRLDALDPTGIEDSIQKVRIKIPYTYMATDVEHDIADLETMNRPKMHEAPSHLGTENVPGPKTDTPPAVETSPSATMEASEAPPKPAPAEEEPAPEVPPPSEPSPEPIPKKMEAPDSPITAPVDAIPVDGLLQRAKDAYGNGDLDGAVRLFTEVLRLDPENSKARFMIRRIGQKK